MMWSVDSSGTKCVSMYASIPCYLDTRRSFRNGVINLRVYPDSSIYCKRLPKNLRYPRRSKLPPEFGTNLFLKKKTTDPGLSLTEEDLSASAHEYEDHRAEGTDVVWEPDEIEAISSLFQGRVPQKPGKLQRDRPLPLPVPHKLRPLGLPTPKNHIKLGQSGLVSPRASVSKQVCRNPGFLVGLAREIRDLPPEKDVSTVLDKWARFLRKGSLSLTVRELGHMGLPERALQSFSWAQKQAHLLQDDWLLASVVEVLAKDQELKLPIHLEKFAELASRRVIEAMVKGFIRGGSLNLAWKLLKISRNYNRMLDTSVYAKMILELGKNPDKEMLVMALLDELAEREDLNMSQQDCTALMKVCVRLKKFSLAESLFDWYKQLGRDISIVMYTTLIHSHYMENKYREAMALIWEMESAEYLFDLPAYRVVIKLFVAMDDLPRAVRYFSKLKEAGFSPTYDIYQALLGLYMASGRIAKCKEVQKEAEMAGFKLDTRSLSGH
ncbi:hypothetical protein SAY86_004863 [Trapa natans]|uniref:Pentatricopeptide repeat-containing protein n=1 Tax=Trapa natans TaxID=22666 RepID=A0AAN7MJ85_TRANT|nr:hypothetical protein SAY86_004863 [Trapa natans]